MCFCLSCLEYGPVAFRKLDRIPRSGFEGFHDELPTPDFVEDAVELLLVCGVFRDNLSVDYCCVDLDILVVAHVLAIPFSRAHAHKSVQRGLHDPSPPHHVHSVLPVPVVSSVLTNLMSFLSSSIVIVRVMSFDLPFRPTFISALFL